MTLLSLTLACTAMSTAPPTNVAWLRSIGPKYQHLILFLLCTQNTEVTRHKGSSHWDKSTDLYSHLLPPRWKLLLSRPTKKAQEGISTFSFEAQTILKSFFNHSAYSPGMSTCILQLMVYSLNTQIRDSLICFLQHFPLSPCCSTFTEPELVCQVHSL